MTFELLQRSIKCLLPVIEKAAAIIYFLLLQLTHKDNILHYKAVKVTIDIFDFAQVISNIIACYYNFSDLTITIKAFSNIVVCYHNFLGLVVTNNSALYPFRTYYCYVIFYVLDNILLLYSICKPVALSKSQIAASKIYLLSFHQF